MVNVPGVSCRGFPVKTDPATAAGKVCSQAISSRRNSKMFRRIGPDMVLQIGTIAQLPPEMIHFGSQNSGRKIDGDSFSVQ